MDTNSAPGRLAQMMTGYWVTRMIYAAAKLDLAGLLKNGPKPADDLAEQTGMRSRELYRLLRGLASLGVLTEDMGGFVISYLLLVTG